MPLEQTLAEPFRAIIAEAKKSLLPVTTETTEIIEDSGAEIAPLNYPLLQKGCLLKDIENTVKDLEHALDTAADLEDFKQQFNRLANQHRQLVKETALSLFAASKNPANDCYDGFFKLLYPNSDFKTYLKIMASDVNQVLNLEFQRQIMDGTAKFVLQPREVNLVDEEAELPADNATRAVIIADNIVLNVESVAGDYETLRQIYQNVSQQYPKLYVKLKQHNSHLAEIFEKIEKVQGHGMTLYDAMTKLIIVFNRGGEKIHGNANKATDLANDAATHFGVYLSLFPNVEEIRQTLKSTSGKSLANVLDELAYGSVHCVEQAALGLQSLLTTENKKILDSAPTMTAAEREQAIKEINQHGKTENLHLGAGEITADLPPTYVTEIASTLKITKPEILGDLLANFDDAEIYKIVVVENMKQNDFLTSENKLGSVFLFLNVTQCDYLCKALGDRLKKTLAVEDGISQVFGPLDPEQCNVVMAAFIKQMGENDLISFIVDPKSLGGFFKFSSEDQQSHMIELLGKEKLLTFIYDKDKLNLTNLTEILKPLKPNLQKKLLSYIGHEKLFAEITTHSAFSQLLKALSHETHVSTIEIFGKDKILKLIEDDGKINAFKLASILKPISVEIQKTVLAFIDDKKLFTADSNLCDLLDALNKEGQESLIDFLGKERILHFINNKATSFQSTLLNVIVLLSPQGQQKVLAFIDDKNLFSVITTGHQLRLLINALHKENQAGIIELFGKDRILKLIQENDKIVLSKLTLTLHLLPPEMQQKILSFMDNEVLFSLITTHDNLVSLLMVLNKERHADIIQLLGKKRILALMYHEDEINLDKMWWVLSVLNPQLKKNILNFIDDDTLSRPNLVNLIKSKSNFILIISGLEKDDVTALLNIFNKTRLLALTENSNLIKDLITDHLEPKQCVNFIKSIGWKDVLANTDLQDESALMSIITRIPEDQRLAAVKFELFQYIPPKYLSKIIEKIPETQHAEVIKLLNAEILKDIDWHDAIRLSNILKENTHKAALFQLLPKNVLLQVLQIFNIDHLSGILKLMDKESIKKIPLHYILNSMSKLNETEQSDMLDLLNQPEVLDKFIEPPKFLFEKNWDLNSMLEKITPKMQVKILELLGADRFKKIIDRDDDLNEILGKLSPEGKACLIKLLEDNIKNIIQNKYDFVKTLCLLQQEQRLSLLQSLGETKIILLFGYISNLSAALEKLKTDGKGDVANDILQSLGHEAVLLLIQNKVYYFDKNKPVVAYHRCDPWLGVYDQSAWGKFLTALKNGILEIGYEDHVLLISGVGPLANKAISIGYQYDGEWSVINSNLPNPFMISSKDTEVISQQIFSVFASGSDVALSTQLCVKESVFSSQYNKVPQQHKSVSEQQAANALITYGSEKLSSLAPTLMQADWKAVMQQAFESFDENQCKALIKAGVNFYAANLDKNDVSSWRLNRTLFNSLCEFQAEIKIEELRQKILTTQWDIKQDGEILFDAANNKVILIPEVVKLQWDEIVAAQESKNYHFAWQSIISLNEQSKKSNQFAFFHDQNDPTTKYSESISAEPIVLKL